MVAEGFDARCPNVARLLHNLQFSTDMESQVMGPILSKVRPNAAARNFLKKNPATYEPWLKGVTTYDGNDGLAAVAAALTR